MLCEEKNFNTRKPCRHPAKFMVIAPAAPRVVCGVHARQFQKRSLIPVKFLGPNFDNSRLPDINGFLRAMQELGAEVKTIDTSIVINVPIKEVKFGTERAEVR